MQNPDLADQDLADQAQTTRHRLKSPPASSSLPFFLAQTQPDLVASHHTHPWNLENLFLKPIPTNPPLQRTHTSNPPLRQTHSANPFLKHTPTNPSTDPNTPPCPDQTTNPTQLRCKSWTRKRYVRWEKEGLCTEWETKRQSGSERERGLKERELME